MSIWDYWQAQCGATGSQTGSCLFNMVGLPSNIWERRLVRRGWLIKMTGKELMEWYQTYGNHVWHHSIIPLQPLLWARLTSNATSNHWYLVSPLFDLQGQNRSLFLKNAGKNLFTPVDVLNYFCSVKRDMFLKAQTVPPEGRKDTVLRLPESSRYQTDVPPPPQSRKQMSHASPF